MRLDKCGVGESMASSYVSCSASGRRMRALLRRIGRLHELCGVGLYGSRGV